MSTDPAPAARTAERTRFRLHGRLSSTSSVRPNAVRTSASHDRNPILWSIFHTPGGDSDRARSATRPARVTAGSGSIRYRPGIATGTAAPGTGTSVSPDGSSVARRVTVKRAGDQSIAPPSWRPDEMNSASHPSGTRSAGIPGATLTPTAAPSAPPPAAEAEAEARARQKPSGGSLCPAASRRDPARRAGSTNTAAPRGTRNRRTSSRTRVTSRRPYTAAFSPAIARCTGSASTAVTGACPASMTRFPPIPVHRSTMRSTPRYRPAMCADTTSDEACSSPSLVNHISSARPNFARPSPRNSVSENAAATSSAG
jgi:hypothetical protein